MTKSECRRGILIAIAVLTLILSSLTGYVYAKYVKSEKLSGSVTLSADLGTVVLQEHKVERKPDGSYELTGEIAQGGNHYTLIPGLDVPKDPHVVITKENDIPVYVYVEVVDELGTDTGITYTMAEGWKELPDVTGANSGKVYYYNDKVTAAGTIYILDGNTINVSQNLGQSASDLKLTFYATMKQAVGDITAEDIYKDKTKY